jgi:hypothetical protein
MHPETYVARVRDHAPEIYEWMVGRIEGCVKDGWLRDA